MGFIEKIKRLWQLPDRYDFESHGLRQEVRRAVRSAAESEKVIRERTEIAVDHMTRPGQSIVILIGRYKGHDYVKINDVDDIAFSELMSHVQMLKKHARLTRVDTPFRLEEIWEREKS